MRNLKRALSLAMASVMLLSMMVVGASAKGIDDFKDKSEIVNQDAVAVTSAIGIFEGYTDGTFKPEQVVTRAEMAVIICKILYGSDVKVAQFTETKVFSDVPAWAEGYVNLCASLGIVVGVGNGKFDPNSTVTTAQAALMLTKALGYFQNDAEYGDNWITAATRKATELKLYGDLNLTASAGLTRENVAVMVFNTIAKNVPVQYNEIFGVYYTLDTNLTAGVIFDKTKTLGYTKFDLVSKNTNNSDEFGRPQETWGTGTYTSSGTTVLLAKNEIIDVPVAPDYTYTGKVKAADMEKELEDLSIVAAYLDGDENEITETQIVSEMKKPGTQMEIFLTGETTATKEKAIVVLYNYYLDAVSRTGKDSDGDYVMVDGKKFHTADFAADDVVAYTIANGDIQTMFVPESDQGKITAVNRNISDNDSYLRMNGNKYSYAQTYVDANAKSSESPWMTASVGDEMMVYIAPNGYLLGIDNIEGKSNYLFVKKFDVSLDARATVVFADGTTARIDVSKFMDGDVDYVKQNGTGTVTMNLLCTYTETDGSYKLTVIGEADDEYTDFMTKGDYYFTGEGDKYYAYDDTIFVDIDTGKVYVGMTNLPKYADGNGDNFVAAPYVDNKHEGKIIFIDASSSAKADIFFYVVKDDSEETTIAKNEYYVFSTANAFVSDNETMTKLTIDSDTIENFRDDNNISKLAGWYVGTAVDENGITKMMTLEEYAAAKGYTVGTATLDAGNTAKWVRINGSGYKIVASSVIASIDYKWDDKDAGTVKIDTIGEMSGSGLKLNEEVTFIMNADDEVVIVYRETYPNGYNNPV